MTLDLAGDAAAIASYFGAVSPPAGEAAIAEATATPPQVPAGLPAVFVYLEDGEFSTGNGSRAAVITYNTRFLLCQAVDIATEAARLLAWAPVLLEALKLHAQLGGRVARAVVDGFEVGLITYAERSFAGIDITVQVTTSEGWVAAA